MSIFEKILNKELTNSIKNNYADNVDIVRFSNQKNYKKPISIRTKMSFFLRSYFFRLMELRNPISSLTVIEKSGLEFLYEKLENVGSKELLIKLIAYRILGYRKVKLPLNNKKYWDKYNEIDSKANKSDFINPNFLNFILYRYKISNYNIDIYFTSYGVLTDFEMEQYAYKNKDILIEAKEGDVVIDAGGCWGDTALYFSSKVGVTGGVYSFEFIPSNIIIFKKNIELNPTLKNRIHLVENPVWEKSELEMFYKDNGPASTVSFAKIDDSERRVRTKSIDDLVSDNELSKVDFIKMDIEGAEPYALKGAIETIKKHKPVLAIAIYHSMDDFINIPIWINELNLGYKFYLGHYTIHDEETVLFAKIQSLE